MLYPNKNHNKTPVKPRFNQKDTLGVRHERYFYFCKYRPVHWTGTRWKKIPFTVQYRPVPFTKYR